MNLIRYKCSTCGNTCLEETKPTNDNCGGCSNPDWQIVINPEPYKIDEPPKKVDFVNTQALQPRGIF